MKRVALAGIIALLLLSVLVVPSAAQITNVTTSNASTTTTTATANATKASTTAAGPTSFLKAQGNATAPPVPGFEFIFAVAGLVCVAFLLLRRRR